MNITDSRKILWNKAAKNGLVLGLFTAACRILAQIVAGAEIPTAGTAVLNGIIWLLQFGGCIWIMRFLMERLTRQFEGVDNRDTARYGRLLALTSSLIFAAAMLFDVLFISPETIDRQMDLYYQLYGQQLDENTRSALKTIEDWYPQIMFFSTWIYSWIYGVILASILSISVPQKDPFTNFMNHTTTDSSHE